MVCFVHEILSNIYFQLDHRIFPSFFFHKTPGLSVASSGERITRDIDFYKKVGEVEHCIVCLLRYKNCLLSLD